MKRIGMAALFLVCTMTGCVMEDSPDSLEVDDSSLPEYGVSNHVYLSCYIDTPAFDVYTQDSCWSAGTQASTASFKLTPHATPSSVVWWIEDNFGNSVAQNCTGVTCNVPIQPGRTLIAGTYYYVNGVPTQGADATAVYEYGW